MKRETETALENLVRIGTVMNVDAALRRVRVKFADTGHTSDWLGVLQRHKTDIHVEPDARHTHAIHDTYSGGGSASAIPEHNHPGTHTTYWLPEVNAKVLVLYIPVFNGHGYVLGEV